MPVDVSQPDEVVATATTFSLSQIFSVTAGNDPACLVVCALDRNEYTAGASGGTGEFSGDGRTLQLSNIGGDGRGAGIVFTYQASTGQYVNPIYGDFSQLTYTTSYSLDDVTNISVFGIGSAAQGQAYASDVYSLMQADPSGYLGSATFLTDPAEAGTNATPPTPDSMAAAAQIFVGQPWNMEGCWVLASAIAAIAGTSLPVQTTLTGLAGQNNGEWVVVYNGPVNANANWQSLVTVGDVVCIGAQGGGHVTTCVSGTGNSALLVDNITYENGNGGIENPANDGSAADILVAQAHPASQEWAGVNASSVVIYALDTPVVTAKLAETATLGTPLALASLVGVTDPAGRSITGYQLYQSQPGAALVVGGTSYSAGTVWTALSVASLANVSLATTSAGTDTVEIRAFNGVYWGDWTSLTVTAKAAALAAPKLAAATPAQDWAQGSAVSLTLPSTLFSDPQHQTLSYTAALAGGAKLPGWLTFNPSTLRFSGTVPNGLAETLTVTITATDTSGLSASENIAVKIPALAPKLVAQTVAQNWAEGAHFSLTLAPQSFADPQGQVLTLKASLASGASLPSWLAFNPATDNFSGTAPNQAESLSLKITATNQSGLSAFEDITVTIAKSVTGALTVADWSGGALTPVSRPAESGPIGGSLTPLVEADLGLIPHAALHGLG